ncbi:MAG: 3'-5' exonuclease [Salibacteraceae bacterium]
MLEDLILENVLFLDIETVPQYASYQKLPDGVRELWNKKARIITRNEENPDDEETYQKAGIYAEFGKIVCISVGAVVVKDGQLTARLKSFFGHDEKALLSDFAELLNRRYNQPRQHRLCGHNGKEFDFPYLSRRMLINGIKLPELLNTAGKKPWEVSHLDTMELWKFGDYKSFTSLPLLAEVFNIPTPKDDIDGSDVGAVYWEEQDLDRIAVYCQKDVLAVIQLVLRYRRQDLISPENVFEA